MGLQLKYTDTDAVYHYVKIMLCYLYHVSATFKQIALFIFVAGRV